MILKRRIFKSPFFFLSTFCIFLFEPAAQAQCLFTLTADTVSQKSCRYALENVEWENLVNTAIAQNDIIKISGGGGWNASATSKNMVYNYGFMQTTVVEENTARMVGLNSNNTTSNFTDIEYAFYLQSNGDLAIYENGSSQGSFGFYEAGDTLRIAISDGVVNYLRNGHVLHTSNNSPTLPMFVDISINTNMGTVQDVIVANGIGDLFSVTATNPGASPTYQWKLNGSNVGSNSTTYTNGSLSDGDQLECVLTPSFGGCSGSSVVSNTVNIEAIPIGRDLRFYISNDSTEQENCLVFIEDVKWESLAGLEENGLNNLVKTTGSNNWDAGAFSYNAVQSGGYMQTVINEPNTNRMFGLNSVNGGSNYNDIDYAFYLQSNGNINIYENGSNQGTWGSYVSGDTLQVAVINNEVRFIQNGSVVFISVNPPSLPLFVDMSLNTVGSTLEQISVVNGAYGRFRANIEGLNNVYYQWKLNGANVGTNNQVYINTSLNTDDTVVCEFRIPNTLNCGADTSFTSNKIVVVNNSIIDNVLFSIRNDSVVNPSCKYAFEEVAWQSISGLQLTGTNNVSKVAGSNSWDAGAFSYNFVDSGGFMQTIVNETNTNRMIGLNATNGGVNYNDIDYAFYLQNNGNILIFENGSNQGTWGSYISGDTLRIAVVGNEVRYIQNGSVVYTSASVPTLPLFVDMSLNTVGATAEKITVNNAVYGRYTAFVSGATDISYQWKVNGTDVGTDDPVYNNALLNNGDTVSCVLALNNTNNCGTDTTVNSNLIVVREFNLANNVLFSIRNDSVVNPSCKYTFEEVAWQSISGLQLTGTNNVSKVAGSNSWDAGAFSYNFVDSGGFMQTIVNETNTNRMIGLNATNGGVNYNDIDYAFYLQNNGNILIFENGSNQGTWGSYASGDTMRISVVGNEVRYIQNGSVVYTSSNIPTLPLFVDMSLNTVGATAEKITVNNAVYGRYTAFVSGATDVAYQWKVNGSDVGTNSPAYVNQNLVDGDQVTCILALNNTNNCGNDTIVASNLITIRDQDLTNNVLFSVRNDSIVEYTCLYADEEVAWQSISGLQLSGTNNVSKAAGSNSWDAAGFSYNQVQEGGYMQTIVNETNTNRMVGLNAVNGGVSYTDIDYAVYLRNNGQVSIFENGSNRGNWGNYVSGDTIKVAVIENEIKYFINGNVIYTSATTPGLPLYVDMCINTVGATLEQITVNNGVFGRFSAFVNGEDDVQYQWKLNGSDVGTDSSVYVNTGIANGDVVGCELSIIGTTGCGNDTIVVSNNLTIHERNFDDYITFYITRETTPRDGCQFAEEEVEWEALSGVEASGNSITRVAGSGWDAGAFSANGVSDNGFFRTVVSETNTNRMVGLNASNTTSGYGDIDYAFYLQNSGNINIYENGSNRGNYGSYATGDTLMITVVGTEVKYHRNNIVLYTSAVSPSPPLFVDLSINSTGGTVTNATVANATDGVFRVASTNIGINPSFQWKLNGVNVGSDSSAYHSDSLSEGDELTCELTPGYVNCASLVRSSNKITFLDEPPQNHTPSFSAGVTSWLGTNNNWFDVSNWTTGVPHSGHQAVIPNGMGNYPVVDREVAVFDLNISNLASLTLSSSSELTIFGDWTHAGSFTHNTAQVSFGRCSDTSSVNTTVNIDLHHMKLKNPVGLKINGGTITVENLLDFRDGIIYNDTSEIIFNDGASCANVSDSTYINGEVRKVGDDAFTFPVGDSNFYAPISISAPGNATDHFTARYYLQDPSSTYDEAQRDLSIHHISHCEYWVLDRTNGSSDVSVTLSWDGRSCGVDNMSDLLVARWDGTDWKDHGNGGLTGNNSAGTISTSGAVTSFSPFTLGSSSSNNPLPVELLEFTAMAENDRVKLVWKTAAEINNRKFTVQRSIDVQEWTEIVDVDGAGNSAEIRNYIEYDRSPVRGTSYYRLKQEDFNGEFSFSGIRVVEIGGELSPEIQIYPNPVSGTKLNLEISDPDWYGQAQITIHNALGIEVLKTTIPEKLSPNLLYPVLIDNLEPGYYVLKLKSLDKEFVQPFIKQ